MTLRIKHFTAVTPNAGDSLIAIKSRDLIREVVPDADIITLAAPITREKIELFGTPDVIIIGGGPLFGSYHLSDFPPDIETPVYLLGVGTMVKTHENQDFPRRLEKFVTCLKNIRLVSTREYATKERLERVGFKANVIGCPAMHIAREAQWHQTNEKDKDTLVFNYRDVYIPDRLLLDETIAQNMAKSLGFKKALIVSHSYEKNMHVSSPLQTQITGAHQLTLRMYQLMINIARQATNMRLLKKYVHPVIHNTLRYLPYDVYTQRPGMKFYDASAYPLLYRNARLLISYQLHASIVAAAVGTPFLHIFVEESNRIRDMIETYDPDLTLHIPAQSATFEEVISKAHTILEDPAPLINYNKRVNEAFKQWELFKKVMQDDLRNLGLIV